MFEMTFDEIAEFDPMSPEKSHKKVMRDYIIELKKKDHTIMAMEEKLKYMKEKTETLSELVNTKTKLASLLEEKLKSSDK